ncbi:ectoine hydroxylase [Novosphingobium album (ex Hu et al. 2023)]|uniref:Ectoine hydroxylase n=1 Tax=Novosphingobium album (ex Hu et al. 2023) TaxID=2930093 RepID=A0ABT0B6J9_9SPHN|nr:ectoine hydroxylase [Novosphingobium album (ex Hu et al. 2023)]MCJ2180702.1 ectoine hydroxylase [Novosphingobium album (ex Hu et al. 2023)]
MQDLYPTRCSGEPELLARQEPVARRAWEPGAPLTAGQIEQFDRDGYLVLEGLFSEAEIAVLQAEMGRLLSDPAGLKDETVITERGSREVRSIFEIHGQSAMLARLAADERLAGVASYLLDDEVYIHQSRLNYKPGFEGKEFYWHSDFETWHAEDGMPRMRALSMSVLLAENTPNNGPLMVIPGSQRVYVTCVGETPDDHYKHSLRKQEYGVPDEDSLAELAHRHGIVAPTGKPGTVVVFDCNVMHGSNGNITPFPRSNAFFVFNAVSNRLAAPFAARKPRPGFIAARDAEPIVPVAGHLEGQEAGAGA